MEITEKNFDADVLNAKGPVLVDFWASWCPPCKMMEPIIEHLQKEYAGRVPIFTINIDRNPRLVSMYQIKGVPTLILFNCGKLVKRLTAAQTENTIRKLLEEAVYLSTSRQT